MRCPRCGAENPDDARFCTSCGTAMDGDAYERRPSYRRRAEPDCFGSSLGALPGLLIGAFIIIIGLTYAFGRDFGMMMGTWGENFGESMGAWGEHMGRFFADWGTSFGSTMGALAAIVLGLAIVVFVLYGRGRR